MSLKYFRFFVAVVVIFVFFLFPFSHLLFRSEMQFVDLSLKINLKIMENNATL